MNFLRSSFFPILHSISLLATLGFFLYSKFIFHKKPITESVAYQKVLTPPPKEPLPTFPPWVVFEPVTINVLSSPQEMSRGKLHYLTVGFALELDPKDPEAPPWIEKEWKKKLLDPVIERLSKKNPHELLKIQERYLLRSELLEHLNNMLPKRPHDLFTQLCFTEWIVQ